MKLHPILRNILNSSHHYGWVSISLHWLMAIALIGLYFLGDYMVELNYYDTWYHTGPEWHKSVGILMGALLLARFVWNQAQTRPTPLEHHRILALLGQLAHLTLYILSAAVILTGYLISTAKGKGIDVFSWFEIPALLPQSLSEELFFSFSAGEAHTLLASLFILMVLLHICASFLHHFFFKDRTLKRMLWVEKPKR